MGRFNKDRSFGGGRGRDRFGGGGRRSDRPEMFDAVCDDCGKDCRVPFRPSGDKPIYCSDCFEKRGNGNSDRGDFRRDSRGGGSRDYRDDGMYSAVCDDCGRDCQVPFRPSGDKPIYCSSCFEKRGNSHDNSDYSSPRSNTQSVSREDSATLMSINMKLEKILQLLEANQIVRVKRTKPDAKIKDEPAVVEEVVAADPVIAQE